MSVMKNTDVLEEVEVRGAEISNYAVPIWERVVRFWQERRPTYPLSSVLRELLVLGLEELEKERGGEK